VNHHPRNCSATSRWRGGTAWLATIGLLVNILLPSAFLVGAGGGAKSASIVFCGAAAHDTAPSPQPAGQRAPHCIFCLVTAVAPAPTPLAAILAPRLAGAAATIAIAPPLLRSQPRFVAAQPRGPPVAA